MTDFIEIAQQHYQKTQDLKQHRTWLDENIEILTRNQLAIQAEKERLQAERERVQQRINNRIGVALVGAVIIALMLMTVWIEVTTDFRFPRWGI